MALSLKSFGDLRQIREGLVFLGCADADSWVDGLKKLWEEEGWIKIAWFESPFILQTTGGRTDLVFPFSEAYWTEDGTQVGKLAIWRLRFGDCSWISDYKINYAGHHNSLPIDHLNRLRDEENRDESKKEQEQEKEEVKPHVKVRPIARMAPRGSCNMKVKKTVGKPTRRSTREKKVPLRYR